MDGEWPLIGRTVELERVAALIGRGSGGVVLAGPAGVGKTRLATECLAMAAGAGFVPLRVGATAAGSALPFGAFASLLPDVVGGVDRLDVLRQVERAVGERGGGKRVALLVDDAHLLDESSAALTHQLAVNGRTLVMATVRTGEPTLDAITALWKDGLAERVEVSPLSVADVEALLRGVLNGPTDGSAARRFWEHTEGNVLFLRELLLGTLEAGVLREDRGIWILQGKLPASQRLAEVVDLRLAGLGPAERTAMEILALGEPIGVELLARSAGGADLDALERRGLLRVEAANRRLDARLGHPLYGETLRSHLSPLRTRALSRALADGVKAAGGHRREDVLRLATWGLQGATVAPVVTLAGAREARSLYEFGLSERLARASIEAGASADAQLLLAELLFLQGRYDETEQVLSAVASAVEVGDGVQQARVALMRIDCLAYGGRGEEAMVVLLTAEATTDNTGLLDDLGVRRALFALAAGYTTTAAELVEPLLGRVSGDSLVTACLVAATAFGLQGRQHDALAAVEQGLAVHRALGRPHLIWDPAMTLAISARILAWAGRLTEAEAVCQRGYSEAQAEGKVEPRGWFGLAFTQCYLAQAAAALEALDRLTLLSA